MQHRHFSQSTQLFDSKPLNKKVQKNQNQRLMQYFYFQCRKKLEHAISQCVSSYMLSHLNSQKQGSFQEIQAQTKREAIQKDSWNGSKVLKDVCQNKRIQIQEKIVEITHNVKQNVYDFVCSVLQVFRSDSTKQQTKEDTKIFQKNTFEIRNQLNESNKGFLIQLFTEIGLLKLYKGMNRNFCKLVQEAQKSYYGVKQFINEQIDSLENIQKEQLQNYVQNIKQDKIKLYETASTIFSMKKRLKQAQINHSKMEQTLQQTQYVTGYEILQEDTYILEQKNHNKQQQINNKSSLSSQLYFTQSQQNQKPNIRQLNLDETHLLFIKLIQKMHGSNEKQYGEIISYNM